MSAAATRTSASDENSFAIDPSTVGSPPAAVIAAIRSPRHRPVSRSIDALGEAGPHRRPAQHIRVGPRPRDEAAQEPVELADHRRVALERQRDPHDVPAAVDLPDPARIRDSHVAVVGDVGPLPADGVDRGDLDSGTVEGDEEQGEPAVLGDVRVRPGEEEDVSGLVGEGGEHLLAVDDPLGPVAHRAGGRGGDVGPGVGFAVPEADQDVASQHPGDDVGPLRVAADDGEGAGDEVGGPPPIHRRADAFQLVREGRARRGRRRRRPYSGGQPAARYPRAASWRCSPQSCTVPVA